MTLTSRSVASNSRTSRKIFRRIFFWNAGCVSGVVHETSCMDFLTQLETIGSSQKTPKCNDGFESVMPAHFVHNESTQYEIPARTPDQTDVAAFIDVNEIHAKLIALVNPRATTSILPSPHFTFAPLAISRSGAIRLNVPSSVEAARIMPCDSKPRILAGSRLATITTFLPMSDSGA